jgi:hypothetical protein
VRSRRYEPVFSLEPLVPAEPAPDWFGRRQARGTFVRCRRPAAVADFLDLDLMVLAGELALEQFLGQRTNVSIARRSGGRA